MNVSKSRIISALNDAGLSVGCKIKKMNLRSIREQARLSLDNVSYIELNVNGTNAIVSVVEKTKVPDTATNSPLQPYCKQRRRNRENRG